MDSATIDTLPLKVVTDSSSNSREGCSSPNTSTCSVVKQQSMCYSTYSIWHVELDKGF